MAPTRIAGIEYAPMPKAGTKASALAWPPRWIVIHDTSNRTSTRYDEARFAATRTDPQSQWTSAHAYVDRGGVLGSLPLTLRAWAAYGEANEHGLHIELCLERDGSIHPDTVRHATSLVRTLLQAGAAGGRAVKLSPADVAARRSGICGHRDITLGLRVGDHQDPEEPGTRFDWAAFMAQVTSVAAAAAAPQEEDDMGASFGPIEIQREGITSLALPPTEGGAADPRAAWLNLCNATGDQPYALRIFYSVGKVDGWTPLAGDGWADGVRVIHGGERLSIPLAAGTCGLDIRRAPVKLGGEVYAGHLTCCVERGPVKS